MTTDVKRDPSATHIIVDTLRKLWVLSPQPLAELLKHKIGAHIKRRSWLGPSAPAVEHVSSMRSDWCSKIASVLVDDGVMGTESLSVFMQQVQSAAERAE